MDDHSMHVCCPPKFLRSLVVHSLLCNPRLKYQSQWPPLTISAKAYNLEVDKIFQPTKWKKEKVLVLWQIVRLHSSWNFWNAVGYFVCDTDLSVTVITLTVTIWCGMLVIAEKGFKCSWHMMDSAYQSSCRAPVRVWTISYSSVCWGKLHDFLHTYRVCY